MTIVYRKADSAAIVSHLEALKKEPWLSPAQAWWPDYLFRVDHVTAAASILNEGKLLSRNRAIATGKMLLDSASPGVIEHTDSHWKDYVRLYFRPRTPTQYHSEGIRRSQEYGLGSCCPIPVVMLFSSREVLTLRDTMFSDGNLAGRSARCGSDSKFLCSIPFRDVYHNDPLDMEARGRIVFHRHAEVIYPNELGLNALKTIYCRTPAEHEMLLSLLNPAALSRWAGSIGLSSKLNLHYRHWTFLETAELTAQAVTLRFNPSSRTPGPFRIDVEISAGQDSGQWVGEDFMANGRVQISDIGDLEEYGIVVKLDDSVIYRNSYAVRPELI